MLKRTLFLLSLLSILLFTITKSGDSLVIPPDPFDSTDRYVLLFKNTEGSITQIQAKIKAPGPGTFGPGEIFAEIRYKLPPSASNGTPKAFHYSVSLPISIQSLDSINPILINFDFSNEPISPQAFHRSLEIFYLSPEEDSTPQEITKFPPERLLMREG